MSVTGSRRLLAVVAAVAFSLAAGSAQAQTRAETLRYVTGASVNTLDPNIPGSTREAFAVSLSTYDRLVSFGRKQLNGKWVFDLGKITGELAESYRSRRKTSNGRSTGSSPRRSSAKHSSSRDR
jgi:peptide/nickel transport system substrate-binding protein